MLNTSPPPIDVADKILNDIEELRADLLTALMLIEQGEFE